MADRSLSPRVLPHAVLYFIACGGAAAGMTYYFYNSLLRAGFMGVGMGAGMALVFLWADWTGRGPLN